MLKSVTIAKDIAAPFEWQTFETDDVLALLKEHFPTWPRAARIYHGTVSQASDVTPIDAVGADRLASMPGPFLVVVYPGLVYLPYIVAIVLAVASYVLAPSVEAQAVPSALARNSQAGSPNNELSDRTNKARINGRIADIFGTVRSTPDLISAPYKVFENNVEVEYAYMCIGRGSYDCSDVRDDTTLVSNIPGSTAEIYAPYTSPNSGDDPQLRIGSAINKRVVTTKRVEGVNGQVLRPPNTSTVTGNKNIYFVTPNAIRAFSDSDIDFTTLFVSGDVLTITNAAVGVVTGGTTTDNYTPYMIYGTEAYDYYHDYYEYLITNGDPDGNAAYFLDLANWAESFVIETEYETVPPGYETGSTITIVTTQWSIYWFGADWKYDGTYTIANSRVYQDTNGRRFLQIKLTDPGSINNFWTVTRVADTGSISSSLPFTTNPATLSAPFKFDVTVVFNNSTAYNLAGTYTAVAVTSKELTLDSPAETNADWAAITTTPALSPTISSSGERWIGPFIVDMNGSNEIICNFVAQNGLYKDDGTDQYAETVNMQALVQQVDSSDAPTSLPVITAGSFLVGSSSLKETVAKTLRFSLSSFSGRCSVKVRRTSPTDEAFEGTVVDEVRWRDLYSVAPVTAEHFGNVTTVFSRTLATASALTLKERKLNLLVTRKLPSRIGETSAFTEEDTLTATTSAADIFCAVCRDRYIGNRTLSELDVANIYDTIAEVEEYFGHANAAKFCHTFDSDNLSFSETIDAIASAVFCTAYRQGNVIRLRFEKETVDSTLLFNHRNKLPGTESRKITFGTQGDYDGVEYTYADPDDGSVLTIFLPEDYASTNPKKIETVGVSNHLQAYFGSWRAYHKLLYQNAVTEFDATEEADLLIRTDRILAADNTRPHTQDGDVLAINTLELTLSQEVDLTEFTDYVIWLQHTDGIAESISITAGSASNKVLLAQAPRLPLVTDSDKSARTTYIILGDEETQLTAFLVDEREPKDRMTNTVKAINYDARYYAHDKDFVDEIVDEDGLGIGGGYTPAGQGNSYTPASSAHGMTAGNGYYGDKGFMAPDAEWWSFAPDPGSFGGSLENGLVLKALWHDTAFGGNTFYVVIEGPSGPPAQTDFFSVSFVDELGDPHTFLSSVATYEAGTQQSKWAWTADTIQYFNTGDDYEITFVY